MIRKSGRRFSEKIMRKQKDKRDGDWMQSIALHCFGISCGVRKNS
jgi:hypothetical protein